VAIDEEDGESWNNLASMYLRMGTVGKKVDETSATGSQVCESRGLHVVNLLIKLPGISDRQEVGRSVIDS
jgi:hypothetical protein